MQQKISVTKLIGAVALIISVLSIASCQNSEANEVFTNAQQCTPQTCEFKEVF